MYNMQVSSSETLNPAWLLYSIIIFILQKKLIIIITFWLIIKNST